MICCQNCQREIVGKPFTFEWLAGEYCSDECLDEALEYAFSEDSDSESDSYDW